MGVDCLGICKYHTTFLGATLPNFEDWSKVIYYNTGLELTPREIWDVAVRGNMMERLFNLREGLKREDLKRGDMLNHRYFDEPCRYKGLDQNGIPKPETLKRLGLENEPSHLV
jgi:aldehyde:ferredoxin oxidoreductase